MFSRASGNPALPVWLARLLLPLVFNASAENAKYRAQIDSSAGLAIFVSDRNDKPRLGRSRRACPRFSLQATALGLRAAFVTFLGLGVRRLDLDCRDLCGTQLMGAYSDGHRCARFSAGADFALGTFLRGILPAEKLAQFATEPGLINAGLLLAFAMMPLIIRRRHWAH